MLQSASPLWAGMNAAISKIRWAEHSCPATAFSPRLESLGYRYRFSTAEEKGFFAVR